MAKQLLQFPNEYAVRALTRSPDSQVAKDLSRLGAEVVLGDLNVPSDLTKALEGCWGVFGVTNFYDPVRLLVSKESSSITSSP